MTRVLLVEDNPIDIRLMSADFRKAGSADFELTSVARLSDAVRVLGETKIDVILLDLFVEDAGGLETLSTVREAAPAVPVVVLTGLNDEDQALQALKHGAQDYLIKGSVDSKILFRAIRYSIERNQLEQRLFEKQKLEALGTLAGGVAHNFNNLLTIILGHCNLMLETAEPGNSRRSFESIKKAANRAAVLTRQLLAFSRKQRVAPAPLDLNKTITDMQLLLESVLGEAIQLQLSLGQSIGLIKADPGQIEQIIMNLAMNARDAMKNGGTLTIATNDSRLSGRENDQDVRWVSLEISDTGCGMSPETCKRVFEPFFTTKGLVQASGLGLSSVYGMVKQNGGTIHVSSNPGSGTTLSMAFPELAATDVEEVHEFPCRADWTERSACAG